MRFVYGFGFETPSQMQRNKASDWDDEDSACVIIETETKEVALEWGRAVAESFLKWLYDDESISWLKLRYADWIEPEQTSRFSSQELRNVPAVKVGQLPPLDRISAHSHPERGADQGGAR